MRYGCCNPVGAAEAVTFYQLTTDRHLLGLNLSGWIQSNPHPQCQDVINSRYWCTAPLASKITSAGGLDVLTNEPTGTLMGLGPTTGKRPARCLSVSCALTAEEKSLCSTSDFLILFPLLEKYHRQYTELQRWCDCSAISPEHVFTPLWGLSTALLSGSGHLKTVTLAKNVIKLAMTCS